MLANRGRLGCERCQNDRKRHHFNGDERNDAMPQHACQDRFSSVMIPPQALKVLKQRCPVAVEIWFYSQGVNVSSAFSVPGSAAAEQNTARCILAHSLIGRPKCTSEMVFIWATGIVLKNTGTTTSTGKIVRHYRYLPLPNFRDSWIPYRYRSRNWPWLRLPIPEIFSTKCHSGVKPVPRMYR